MHRFARFLSLLLAAILLANAAVPAIALAQNVCVISDTECTPDAVMDHHPCVCAYGPYPPIPGICIAQNTCQGNPTSFLSSLGSFISNNPILTAAGIGVAAIGIGALLSSSGGSDSSDASPSITAATAPANFPTALTPSGNADSLSSILASMQSSAPSPALSSIAGAPASPSNIAPTPASAPTDSGQPSSTEGVSAADSGSGAAPPSSPVRTLLQALAPVSSSSAALPQGSAGAPIGNGQSSGSGQNAAGAPLAAPAPLVVPVSLPPLGFVQSPGTLWGSIILGTTSADIFVGDNAPQSTQAMQFYGADSSAIPGTTSAASLCTQRPWASGLFSSIIPGGFFDHLCGEAGY